MDDIKQLCIYCDCVLDGGLVLICEVCEEEWRIAMLGYINN